MILRAIEVQGWRCLANRCRLGPFSERLNIVHAPNGSGKSTVFEALRRGLFDGYKVTGEGIEQIRSWGRELAPAVTIEFAHGSHEYRLTKRFVSDRAAELSRLESGKWIRLHEGEAADTAARQILSGEKPGRGLSGPEHWGLAQVLWSPQGELACGAMSGGLLQTIRSALDVQAADAASGPLEEAIRQQYLATFTERGEWRKGDRAPRWIGMQSELETLRAERLRLEEKVRAFEDASRRVEDLRIRRDRAASDESAAHERLEAARAQALRFTALTAEKNQRTAEVTRFESEHRQHESRARQIAERRAELSARETELQAAETQLPALAEQAKVCGAEEQAAAAALQSARAEAAKIETLRVARDDARRFAEAQEKARLLRDTIAAVEAANSAVESARTEFAKCIAPDVQTLQKIRAAVTRRIEAAAKLDASLITLEIVPERDVTAKHDAESIPLAAAQSREFKGSPEVVVEIEGFGRIRARGPSESTEALRSEAQNASRKVDELTRPFGTADLAALEEMHDVRKNRAQALADAETRLAALLAGRTRETLLAEEAAQTRTIEELTRTNPEWKTTPPDAAKIDDEWRAKLSSAPDLRAVEARWEGASSRAAAARQTHAIHENTLANTRASVAALRRQLATLETEAGDEKSRIDAAQKIALEWQAAKARLGEVEASLREFPADPTQAVSTLEKQITALREQARRSAEEETFEKGRLQSLVAEAPYARLAETEEAIAKLDAEIARGRAAAEAIKLLHETVAKHRALTVERISEPVQTRALAILERVAGRKFDALQLGEKLQLQSIRPSIGGEGVALSNLSGGEQEQVHLAVRLALAQVLAASERQLVVLDDILVATDSARLARVLRVLEEISQRVQIIVLTCHPERYYGVEAEHFDLEKLKLA